jgi:hypothetical protein
MDAEIGTRQMKIRTVAIICIAGLMLAASHAVWAKVYRWVDENGDVHYSESLPTDFEDQKHDLINRRGDVVRKDMTTVPPPPKPKSKKKNEELPRDKSGMRRPAPLYPKAEMQRRMDTMLLLRYETEKDLIDAMNVEINQLSYDKNLISTSLSSVRNTYRANIKEAGDRQRAGMQVSGDLEKTLKGLRGRVTQGQKSLHFLKQREALIRQEFDTERVRYRRLVKERAEQS